MNTEMSPRSSTASRTLGLTIVAFALVSCAADDLTKQPRVASRNKAVPTMSAAPTEAQQCADQASPHAVFLEDADGNAFQLVHIRGQGWKYVTGGKSDRGERNLTARKIGFSPIAEAQAETQEAAADDPMAVFIDGPTGYTFAWTGDAGWKFVGHITDQNQ